MLRPVFITCALLAGATCAARPMVIHQSQTLEPPAGAGYYFFGYEVAIEGDWAIIVAATPSPSPGNPQQTHDALLYHRVNGLWTLDRTLVRRVSTDSNPSVHFASVAIRNGVAAIGSNPVRIFKRTDNTWTEIAHPFTAPRGDPDWVNGDLLWDGSRLLAVQNVCLFQPQPWGALISRLNADGSWSPIERLSSGDTACVQEPISWGISGPTVVAGTWTNDFEVMPEQLRIFRRSGTTWIPTSAIDGGSGEGDVRGDEIFISSRGPGGTLVYRNDDSQTVVDNVRTVSTSYGSDVGSAFGFTHTSDVFVQENDLFRKNAAGKYEHVARLIPTGPHSLVDEAAINGHRMIFPAYRDQTSLNQEVLTFDLPTTYTPSPVIATGFESGPLPFEPQLGRFTVVMSVNGNHVYRQSSTASNYRALLGDSDWIEQSIEADIRPSVFSGSDRWAGLAVRYLDDANYYYVTLRSSGVVALKRIRNGVVSTMAQKAFPIVAGRSYHVSLQASGTLVTVRLDGKVFIWGQESQLIPHGSAALLGYRTAVDYDNVVAAQVGQLPIFDLFFGNCNGPLIHMRVWTTNGTGNWNCSSNTGENIMQQTSTAGDARALVGTPTDDQVVMTRARATSFAASTGQVRWFGIAARYVDESNYYYLTVRNSNTVSLRKVVNGAITVLGTAPLTVRPNTWYDLRLDVVGDELRAFVNGRQLLQAIDTTHASGQGGILTYKTAAEYVNYLAWQP